MGTVVRVVFLMVVASCCFAQQVLDVDFTNAGGELIGVSSGLEFFNGVLVSVGKNGQAPFLAGTVGTVTFSTPGFRSGDMAQGGVFGSGGSFYISTTESVDVTATFVSGTWSVVTLPNATHNYVLKARIKGTMFLNGTNYNIQGAAVQLSTNTGKGLLGGSQPMSGGSTNIVTVP